MKKHKGCKVIFTGHSLGGALANYAAIRFTEKEYAKNHEVLCYTSGQPRMGNQYYANYHDKNVPKSFRITYKNDPIPNLPPRESFPFRHGGTEVWYDEKMSKIKNGVKETKMSA